MQEKREKAAPGAVQIVEEAQNYAGEEEYIVLNRQEEEEGTSAEEAQKSLENYTALAGYQYFDCEAIRKDMRLTKAVMQKGEKLLQEKKVVLRSAQSGYVDGRNDTVGEVIGEGREGKTTFPIHMVFTRDTMLFAECQCPECRKHFYSRYYRREFCAFISALLELTKEYQKQNNLGDATDKRAMLLMRAFTEQRANHVISDAIGREKSLRLIPRVTRKGGELAVSFKVGEKKLFVVKDLFEFYQDVQESKTSFYGNNTSINHHISNFTENSLKWIDYIGRIVKEELAFERRMIEARNYSKRAAAKNGEFALFGWRLDELYGLVEGEDFEFEDRDSEPRRKTSLRREERNPRISMTIRKNDMGSHRSFHGITVNCRMPEFYYGVRTAYYAMQD